MSAILIILFVIPASMHDSRPDDAKVNNCAVNVAFSAFLYFGLDVKYESVAELFPIPFRRDGVQVPMSVVQDVLTTNGLPATAVRYETNDGLTLRPETILLIYPGGLEFRSQGHYVFVKDVTPNEIQLIDSLSLGGEVHMSHQRLKQVWDGHAIMLGENKWASEIRFTLAMLLPVVAMYRTITIFAKSVRQCIQGCRKTKGK